MKSQTQLTLGCAPLSGPDKAPNLERFSPTYRRGIEQLARRSDHLADLIRTFPGLAFALATGYGTPANRTACRRLIDEGAPLRKASDALQLPWWLRKLPPEAFAQPIRRLPSGRDCEQRMATYVPLEPWKASSWLQRVQIGCALAGDSFGLWIAKQTKNAPRNRDTNRWVLLSAYAWYSARPETFAGRLLRVPFVPSLSLRRAIEEADTWRRRIELAVTIGHRVADTWYARATVNGYDFVPLRTLDDFIAEATIMDNCLDQYGGKMCVTNTRVFSIRLGATTVADVEIGPHEDDANMPGILQLRGPGNRRVSPAVWQAAYAWLGSQTPVPINAGASLDLAAARMVARDVWRPFVEASAAGHGGSYLAAYLQSGDVFDPEL